MKEETISIKIDYVNSNYKYEIRYPILKLDYLKIPDEKWDLLVKAGYQGYKISNINKFINPKLKEILHYKEKENPDKYKARVALFGIDLYL